MPSSSHRCTSSNGIALPPQLYPHASGSAGSPAASTASTSSWMNTAAPPEYVTRWRTMSSTAFAASHRSASSTEHPDTSGSVTAMSRPGDV